MSTSKSIFEEKILYKTRRHCIVPLMKSIQLSCLIVLPVAFITYFISTSWIWTWLSYFSLSAVFVAYIYYLWYHSWLLVGNQKITLSVRNGIFSQYAMNVRYRNIRDAAVSKHNIFEFLFKYGTIFVRSSANEGDFHAEYVPKVWKVYALVNALSRYSDEERSKIDSIEKLHAFHQEKEFPNRNIQE